MKIKIGIIGLGIGEKHLQSYNENKNCEVIAICDFDDLKLQNVSAKYPAIKIKTTDADEVLNNPEINLISIASWDSYHAAQIITGLKNKKHLFVEKPLCINENEAAQIKSALDKNPELKLGTNLILRLYPRFSELKSMIDNDILGNLTSIEGDYNYGRLHKITEGWRGADPGYSGVFGGGIHIADLMLWLTKRKVKEVAAFGGNIASAGSQFENFDIVTAVLKFEDGLVGKLSVNLGCVYPHFHRFSVYGTKATFENSFEGAALYKDRDQNEQEQVVNYNKEKLDLPYPGVGKGDYLDQFIHCIINDSVPPISRKEIFDALSVCFAIEAAAHSGKIEQVRYF